MLAPSLPEIAFSGRHLPGPIQPVSRVCVVHLLAGCDLPAMALLRFSTPLRMAGRLRRCLWRVDAGATTSVSAFLPRTRVLPDLVTRFPRSPRLSAPFQSFPPVPGRYRSPGPLPS